MTKEKQIEEMAKVMNECCNRYDEQGNHLGNKCFDCECWCDTNHICCSYNQKEAMALYDAGYRKASEVARAIFEEIEEEITAALKSNYKVLPQLEFSNELYNRVQGKVDALRGVEGFVAELKKKYTESEKDNEL